MYLTKQYKQQFLDNLDTWNCILGKGMDNQMFGLITYSSMYCKMGCKVLMDGYCVFRDWILEHTELDVDSYITIQSLATSFMLKSGCYELCFKSVVFYNNLSHDVLLGVGLCVIQVTCIMLNRTLLISMLVVSIRVPCILWMVF